MKTLGYALTEVVLVGLMGTALSAQAQELPRIEAYTAGLPRQPGPLPAYFEPSTGRVLLEVRQEDEPVLHVVLLSSGGTPPIDRGTFVTRPSLLRFRRRGGKVDVIEDNPGYRATRDSSLEEVVSMSFPSAVLASLPLLALSGATWLVDGTDFLIRDAAYRVAERLSSVGESATLDRARSNMEWPTSIDSDVSTDLDVQLTFDVPGGGRWLEDRSPSPTTLSVVLRHIFFRLSPGFHARSTDERLGLVPVPVRDFSETPSGGYRGGWVRRWRLSDTSELGSVVQRPITFFLESAIPLEYRNAIRDGVDYWRRTMEAIGLSGAVQVADLPEGVDPFDLRYPAVFVWTPRRQPMSSGATFIVDPRSGEVIKAVIQMDAHWPLVARNEYRAYRPALLSGLPSEAEYVHARVAWVAAHEVAHVIAGLSHTGYAETAVGFRLPRISASGDRIAIDLDQVVPEVPLPYDLWLMRYAYYPPAASGEEEALQDIIAAGRREGLRYVSYQAGLLMPEAVSRIRNPDILGELHEAMSVRSNLLSHFGAGVLDAGEPSERLFERLVPVYFHHRFALQAASRMLGGLRVVNGADEFQPIPREEQLLALDVILDALSPGQLTVPPEVVQLMPPAPAASPRLDLRGETDQEGVFRFQTGDTAPIDIGVGPWSAFDPVAWAHSLTDITLADMLAPPRAARLEAQAIEDPSLPGLGDVVEMLLSRTWDAPAAEDPIDRRYERVVQQAILEQLIDLASEDAVSPAVRNTVLGELSLLRGRLNLEAATDPVELGMLIDAMKDLDQLLTSERKR